MALDRRLLDLLCCPINRRPLRMASPAELGGLSAAAAAGSLRNSAGQAISAAPDAALLEAASGRYYPVVDDIPVLLTEAALRIEAGTADATHSSLANSTTAGRD